MVGYLHQCHNDVPFQIASTASTPQFGLFPKPAKLLVNQGHTSNGAAGTALILVSVLGALVLWGETRGRRRSGSVYTHVRTTSDLHGNTHTMKSRTLPTNWGWLYPTWVGFTVVSVLLTLAALIYTFVVTHTTDSAHSAIELGTAAAASRRTAHGHVAPYPGGSWTPENWYKAVLGLEFVDEGQKGDIRTHVHLMEGWRWNLIPLLVLGCAVMGVAMHGYLMRRRGGGADGGRRTMQEKRVSATSP